MVLKEHNLKILDLISTLNTIEKKMMAELLGYGLHEYTSSCSKDIERLIMHHFIYHLCNVVLNTKGNEKIIFYFTTSAYDRLFLVKFLPEDNLHKIMNSLIRGMKRYLPIRLFQGEITYQNIQTSSDGKKQDIIASITSYIQKNDLTRYSFLKAKKFTLKHQLSFLNRDFFNTFKTKQLLLK